MRLTEESSVVTRTEIVELGITGCGAVILQRYLTAVDHLFGE